MKDSDRAVFLSDFVDRISWDTGQSSYADIEKDIKRILAELPRPITDPLEVKQVIYRLWYFVTHSIAGRPGKTLNRADLEAALSEETTARIDRESLKIMAADSTRTVAGVENLEKMVSVLFDQATKQIQDAASVQVIEQQTYQSILPPLLKPCADRSQEIEKIQDALNSEGFLWIHGSTGYATFIINSRIGQAQLLRDMTIATTVGHITNRNIAKLLIPYISDAFHGQITNLVGQSIEKQQESKRLLDQAKTQVEQLIEAVAS